LISFEEYRCQDTKIRVMAARRLAFFTTKYIPNPDVVHMYLEETGRQAAVHATYLDLGKDEHRSNKNPTRRGSMPRAG
jgi:hypothetical protein